MMRRNVLFCQVDDTILCDGNYGLGAYGMDLTSAELGTRAKPGNRNVNSLMHVQSLKNRQDKKRKNKRYTKEREI